MKQHIKYIGMFLTVVMVIFIVSCGPSDREANGHDSTSDQFIEILNLQNDSLTFKNIKAFEQRAIQKLQDLKDYFEILSDSTIEQTFKKQALDMARGLFASGDNTITFKLLENQEITALKVDSFFISLQNDKYGVLTLQIYNVSVTNSIKKLDDAEYKGAIKFRLFVFEKQVNTKTLLNKTNMQCDIIAKKVKKKFGNETKQVWEVFLGNIYQVQ
jgi:hypothetical protein